MNQFLGTLALLPIEKILNGLVAHDSHVATQLEQFEDKCVEVISHSPNFSICIRFEQQRIKLGAIDSASLMIEPDASISGKAEHLLGLLLTRTDQRALADPKLSIAGDALLVQDLYKTLNSLDLDWEDYLAPFFGDVLSNQLGNLSREARGWSEKAEEKVKHNVHDYLVEETAFLPGKEELAAFNDDLDLLRLNIDRLTARTQNIRARLDDLEKTQ